MLLTTVDQEIVALKYSKDFAAFNFCGFKYTQNFEMVIICALKMGFTRKVAVLEAVTSYKHILVHFCGSLLCHKCSKVFDTAPPGCTSCTAHASKLPAVVTSII